jgi:hypothetical protein
MNFLYHLIHSNNDIYLKFIYWTVFVLLNRTACFTT